MSRLTPADVRNIRFKKPGLGRRGYDEEEVDNFLDEVVETLTALEAARGGPAGGDELSHAVLADLDQIKVRLARIEAALDKPRRGPGDPLFS